MLDQLVACVKLNGGVHVHLNPAFGVHHPSAKVPRELFHAPLLLRRLKFLRVATQPLKDIVGVWAIHVALFKNWKLDAKLFAHRLFDLCIGRLLLV